MLADVFDVRKDVGTVGRRCFHEFCDGIELPTQTPRSITCWNVRSIEHMDDAVAGCIIRLRDGGSVNLELVAVLGDRCSLNLHHLRYGELFDVCT